MNVAVVGAAGYAGAEAMRWVLGHPRLALAMATSAADAGARVESLYPQLGETGLVFESPDADAIGAVAEIAILAVPHTASLGLTPRLIEAGVTVIDLSADFRLSDPSVYSEWYGVEHGATELLARSVFGLPELDRSQLRGASLVACAGCYPTATTLAALPALKAGLSTGSRAIVDAKSGVSGAGRSPSATVHYVAATESVSPYKVGAHRHTPEMEQALSLAAGRDVSVMFTPHLVPMARGLLSTVYLDAPASLTTEDAVQAYREFYAGEPFVNVHDAGVMPSTAEVRGTSRAAVGVHVDSKSGTLVAACAIDNLGKGAASQGIQCLNAVLGFPETEGLDPIGPVV